MRSGPNWYQIGQKHDLYQKFADFYVEKGYLC